MDGAFDQIFNRAVFQANEYNQIFESTIEYPNPIKYGFEECQGGLRPTLNSILRESARCCFEPG